MATYETRTLLPGISAREILGDKSGTAVPAGMLGEKISTGNFVSDVTINTSATAIGSITISAGTWLLFVRGSMSYTTGTGVSDRGYAVAWITDGSTVYGQTRPAYAKASVAGNQIAGAGAVGLYSTITTSSTKTLTFNCQRLDLQSSGGATAVFEGASNSGEFYAVRIA